MELLQTKETGTSPSGVTQDLETSINAIRGGGQPLPESVRVFFEPRFGYDFSRVRVHADGAAADGAGAVRARAYTIGRDIVFGSGEYAPATSKGNRLLSSPGDMYEEDADRVAEQVMRMPDAQLQRACACGGSCPKCQTQKPDEDHERLQTKRVQASDTGQMAAPPIVHEVLAAPGQPLDLATRDFMEPRFGHNFAHVRVHADAKAAESARAVNALAYTAGRNVVFDAGQYAPGTSTGQRLLAHELTHVLQQSDNQTVTGLAVDDSLASYTQLAPLQIARQDAGDGEEACWRTEDIIDDRIDVHAQYALMRMFSRGGQQASDASAILSAVKSSQLEGVYLPDEGVPALRARAAGSNWWEMIPPGKLATCYKQPEDRVPLITFRKTIKDDRDMVAEALSLAWAECAIPASPPRCYTPTIEKPKPEPETEDKPECETDQDCLDKNLGDYCTPEKYCVWRQPVPEEPCECNLSATQPHLPCWLKYGWNNSDCVHKPGSGEDCGVCTKPGGEKEKCTDRVVKQYTKEWRHCNDEEEKATEECVKASLECSVTIGAGDPDPEACAKTLWCVGTAEPKRQGEKCRKEAYERKKEALKKCKEVPE